MLDAEMGYDTFVLFEIYILEIGGLNRLLIESKISLQVHKLVIRINRYVTQAIALL